MNSCCFSQQPLTVLETCRTIMVFKCSWMWHKPAAMQRHEIQLTYCPYSRSTHTRNSTAGIERQFHEPTCTYLKTADKRSWVTLDLVAMKCSNPSCSWLDSILKFSASVGTQSLCGIFFRCNLRALYCSLISWMGITWKVVLFVVLFSVINTTYFCVAISYIELWVQIESPATTTEME